MKNIKVLMIGVGSTGISNLVNAYKRKEKGNLITIYTIDSGVAFSQAAKCHMTNTRKISMNTKLNDFVDWLQVKGYSDKLHFCGVLEKSHSENITLDKVQSIKNILDQKSSLEAFTSKKYLLLSIKPEKNDINLDDIKIESIFLVDSDKGVEQIESEIVKNRILEEVFDEGFSHREQELDAFVKSSKQRLFSKLNTMKDVLDQEVPFRTLTSKIYLLLSIKSEKNDINLDDMRVESVFIGDLDQDDLKDIIINSKGVEQIESKVYLGDLDQDSVLDIIIATSKEVEQIESEIAKNRILEEVFDEEFSHRDQELDKFVKSSKQRLLNKLNLEEELNYEESIYVATSSN